MNPLCKISMSLYIKIRSIEIRSYIRNPATGRAVERIANSFLLL